MAEPTAEDIAAMRADGDLTNYLIALTGRSRSKPKQTEAEQPEPIYHIPRKGAWPCGTAASGPTPPPCTHNQTA